jgi:ATP-binding cassette subfamily B protein
MMEDGFLVETGSHTQLMSEQGRYFALYSQQESDID